MLDIPFSISTSCYGFCLILLCVLDLVWVPVLLVLRLWIRGQQNNNLIAWVLASRCVVAQGDLRESDTLLHFVCNILFLYTGTLTPKCPPPLLKTPWATAHLGARAQAIPRVCYLYLRIVSLLKSRFSAIMFDFYRITRLAQFGIHKVCTLFWLTSFPLHFFGFLF